MKNNKTNYLFKRSFYQRDLRFLKKLITAQIFIISLISAGTASAQTDEEKVAVLSTIINGFINKVTHPDGVCLYSETDFRGLRLCFTSSMPALSAEWNNKASSISVSSSYHGTIYRDPNYAGSSLVLDQNSAELGSLDNLISSIKLIVKDEDGDGVIYSHDACPNTPPGETISADGCSLSQRDTDHDGVSDAVDRCDGSTVADEVDLFGCSGSQDSDGDGIINSEDAYPFQHATQCRP